MSELGSMMVRILRSSRVYSGLGANGLSSLGNFAVSITLARVLAIAELGQFAIAFALYALFTGIIRAAVCEPLLAMLPTRSQYRNSAMRASLLGIIFGAILVTGGFVSNIGYVVIAGMALHGLTLYDYSSTMNMATFDRRIPLYQESVRFIVSIAVGVLVSAEVINGIVAFTVWAAAGAAVGYGAALLQGCSIKPKWNLQKKQSRTSLAFGGDFVIGSGASQIAFNLVGVAAGLSAVGSLRAGGTLLGPVSMVISSARSLTIPYLSRAMTHGRSRAVAGAIASTTVIASVTLPVLGTIAFLPDRIGILFLGKNWYHAEAVIGLLAMEMAFIALTTIPFAGFRAMLAGRLTVIIRTALAIFRVAIVVSAAYAGGVIAAAGAMAIASGTGMAVWWLGFILAMNKSIKE